MKHITNFSCRLLKYLLFYETRNGFLKITFSEEGSSVDNPIHLFKISSPIFFLIHQVVKINIIENVQMNENLPNSALSMPQNRQSASTF